jgi:hypothetical protein
LSKTLGYHPRKPVFLFTGQKKLGFIGFEGQKPCFLVGVRGKTVSGEKLGFLTVDSGF